VQTETAPARLRTIPSWLLNQAGGYATRLVSDALGAVSAKRYHYSLLATLAEFGPDSQAALGRRCGIDPSDMVATVNELAEHDLLRRTADPNDRRRNEITITAAGRRHLRKLDGTIAGAQDRLLEQLSGTERDELIRLLTKIVESAE
jgi:DNA-binding MarR family transcriptional regulator